MNKADALHEAKNALFEIIKEQPNLLSYAGLATNESMARMPRILHLVYRNLRRMAGNPGQVAVVSCWQQSRSREPARCHLWPCRPELHSVC